MSKQLDFDDFFNAQQRIIYIFGSIDEMSTYKALAALDILSTSERPITVKIRSDGGDAYCAMALYDAIQGLDNHITTMVMGAAFSSGGIILQAGDTRVMQPRSSFMMHQATHNLEVTTDSLLNWAGSAKRDEDMTADLFAERTGKTRKFWANKFKSDFIATADECLKLNLIDEIR